MWAESTDLSICQASPWYQRLRIDWSLLTQSLPIWLRSNSPEPLEVLICVTGEDDQALLGTEPCLDLWPELPHRRVRNERTGALRVHVAKLAAMSSLRVSCVWQEPIDPSRSRRPRPQLLVYSSGPLAAFCEPGIPPQLGFCEPPREVQKYWQASVLCSGCWTSGFSSGFGSLRNPQVVLEVLRGPSKGEELQLELYLCVPGKGKARPKTALTVFVRQEEHRASPGAPERLAEGVLRREIGSGKALGSYVVSSLRLTGAESRQQLYCVLQNDDPQERRGRGSCGPWQGSVPKTILPVRHWVRRLARRMSRPCAALCWEAWRSQAASTHAGRRPWRSTRLSVESHLGSARSCHQDGSKTTSRTPGTSHTTGMQRRLRWR
ncbi:unnamed protein product [Effrenium voratum]|uniref:Uncharacterized protein n=1 Tax=Effrenium voratum TaxID=2562239 RepID=A0AA36ICZ6_9DINO|nr:unnamed protein product [Effrenium voratum]